jgi:tungstate transport system ATP-binding protein
LSLPNLTVNAGKVTALISSNGCGKSTLLNLLAFMEAPNTGKITFFGKQVRSELNQSDAVWVNFKSNIVMAF